MKTLKEVTLGASYEDIITGFKGVAIGKVEYLTDCNQVLLLPKIKKDGTKLDGFWIDIQRLKILDAPVIELDNGETPGCDMSPPIR